MLRGISALGFVASLICCSTGQAQATYCDWIGPGGRAVYRCGLIGGRDVTPQRQTNPHRPARGGNAAHDPLPWQHRYLMDFYLDPSGDAPREFANTLANSNEYAGIDGELMAPATDRQRTHQNS